MKFSFVYKKMDEDMIYYTKESNSEKVANAWCNNCMAARSRSRCM